MRMPMVPSLVAALVSACVGAIDGGGGQRADPAQTATLPQVAGGSPGTMALTPAQARTAPALQGGLRRLSRVEYDNTLRDLLGEVAAGGIDKLPEEVRTPERPFDNDFTLQQASSVLIETAEALAQEIAARVARDAVRRKTLVPCTPSGAQDPTCLRSFVTGFGRRALRRPLAWDEVDRLMALARAGEGAANFWTAVEIALRGLLQHPELLYRVEIGQPIPGRPGVAKLTGYEVATRLSYLLQGTTPDDALLDDAAAGRLETPAQARAAAQRLLADRRARDQIARLHAQWLSYTQLPHAAALSTSFQQETRALVERAVFGPTAGPGTLAALFSAQETFVSPALARHYGLPAPAGAAGWVSYGTTERRGILSHGAVLSAYAKPADTSPTLRGRFISTRLFCREIPEPPPDIDPNETPKTASPCKKDIHESRTGSGVCHACHKQMDPIGFGLENFDREGRYRTHDDGQPRCTISGEGAMEGFGSFKGPAGLATLALSSGALSDCYARHVFRFAAGHHEQAEDQPFIAALVDSFATHKDLRALLLELVSQPGFLLVRGDEEGRP